MAFQIGDIVKATAWEQSHTFVWVVTGLSANIASLIRRIGNGYSHYKKNVDDLTPVSRPAFQSGEPVTIAGNKAVFMSRDGHRARVLLAPQRWAIAESEIMDVGPAVAVFSYVTLVLENRWADRANKEN